MRKPLFIMNYLAHIYLSFGKEDVLIGNFIADFIKNKELPLYDEAIHKGIFLHREIDSYTDNHAIIRQGTKRLRKNHGKYGAVVIDILYDNLLATNWDKYHDQSLEEYAQFVYAIFQDRMDELPELLQRSLPQMIEQDWLSQYQYEEGIRKALGSLDKRTRFPSNFIQASEELNRDRALYNEEFHQFFPEVIAFAKNHLKQSKNS